MGDIIEFIYIDSKTITNKLASFKFKIVCPTVKIRGNSNVPMFKFHASNCQGDTSQSEQWSTDRKLSAP